jgi:nucleoside-diphosphate-sugar epimerase
VKVAVTGATGGLGRSLVEHLRSKGVDVVALGRNVSIGKDIEKTGAKFVACEIDDEETLSSAFEGCDQVVHSAGLAAPWGAWSEFERANVKGTRAVLAAMRTAVVDRLVHISTPSVYFDGRERTNVKESDPLPEPTNLYAKSKAMADDLVRLEVDARGLSAVLVRPRSIYGKYDRTIMPRMLRVMERGFFPLPDGGRALVDVTAVENVVHFIWLCLTSDRKFRGDAYNVTNGEPMTVRELLEIVATSAKKPVRFISIPSRVLLSGAGLMEVYAKAITKREPPFARHSIHSLAVSQTLSIEKAKEEMGYSPVVSTRESIVS